MLVAAHAGLLTTVVRSVLLWARWPAWATVTAPCSGGSASSAAA